MFCVRTDRLRKDTCKSCDMYMLCVGVSCFCRQWAEIFEDENKMQQKGFMHWLVSVWAETIIIYITVHALDKYMIQALVHRVYMYLCVHVHVFMFTCTCIYVYMYIFILFDCVSLYVNSLSSFLKMINTLVLLLIYLSF